MVTLAKLCWLTRSLAAESDHALSAAPEADAAPADVALAAVALAFDFDVDDDDTATATGLARDKKDKKEPPPALGTSAAPPSGNNGDVIRGGGLDYQHKPTKCLRSAGGRGRQIHTKNSCISLYARGTGVLREPMGPTRISVPSGMLVRVMSSATQHESVDTSKHVTCEQSAT